MYIRQNPNTDKPLQVIDFSSLKKKTSQQSVFVNGSKITFHSQQQPITIPMILGFYQFLSGAQINQTIFSYFNLDQCPKHYQPYAHQKTLKALLKVIMQNSQSQNTLVSLLDQFPIVGFVLEAYTRAVVSSAIKSRKELVYQGREEVLENFAMDVRGDLLKVMADALGVHLTLICGEFIQSYGLQNQKRKITVCYTGTGVSAELISPRKNHNLLQQTQTSQNSVTKTLKQLHSMQTQASQSQQVSSIQSSSCMLKDSVASLQANGRCQKCKLTSYKCFCGKKPASTYTTPKSVTSNQKSPGIAPNGNIFAMLNHSKCTCHKMVCVCRK